MNEKQNNDILTLDSKNNLQNSRNPERAVQRGK